MIAHSIAHPRRLTLGTVLDWALPSACAVCGEPAGSACGICAVCIAELPPIGEHCPRCAGESRQGLVCGQCRSAPPAFDRTIAPYRYAPPLDRLLTACKFGRRLEIARVLGELLANRLGSAPTTAECIIPVPLHPTRLRQRGFNQALEIARVAARRTGIMLDYACVQRQRATAPQSDLSVRQRRANIRGAFAVHRALACHKIAIVDDVMTTASTAHELARVLRASGADEIDIWAVSRA